MENKPGNDVNTRLENWTEKTGAMWESNVKEEDRIESEDKRWFKGNRKPLRAESIPDATRGRM